MKRLVIMIMIMSFAMISCNKSSGPKKGRTTTSQPTKSTQEFAKYSLVVVDGETFIVDGYSTSDDYYRLFPVHSEGEGNYLRVIPKYIKQYNPKQ
jgi:hypothetical protein